jgi:hypothetical protein
MSRARRYREALPDAAVALLTLVFAAACAAFVRQPWLASFADDSVSYLIMAQVFSPWQAASAPVAEAFVREAFYPPLFPLLLALAGAAHDMAWAHVLTALMLAACLPVVYFLGACWLGDRRVAAFATLAVALLPALWVNAKGVLSEPLFCLLLLGTFLVLETVQGPRARMIWLALLMAALALTRTVGLIPIAAYGVWVLVRHVPAGGRWRSLMPVVIAFAAYASWVAVRPAATSDSYAQIIGERAQLYLGAQGPVAALAGLLLRQAHAMAEAWIGLLMLYWVEGSPLRALLACAIGLLALGGLGWRFVQGKPDAWMLAAYVATYLIWPFDDQMERFLFPALPVLVLYAFVPLSAMGRHTLAARAVLGFLLLGLGTPAMAFIYQRAHAQGPYVAITDWYRKPSLAEAQARATTHLDLLADMDSIGRLTRPEDRVMWVAPAYLALLADRRGMPAPRAGLDAGAYRVAVRASAADYVFLSVYHPRDTIHDTAWQEGARALIGHAKIVHARTHGDKSAVSSILFKLER